MAQVFLKLFNMSISAGWVILAVLVLRLVMKRASKNYRLILWAAVSFRLVCPFTLESVLSLLPSAQTVPEEVFWVQTPQVNTGVNELNSVINPVLETTMATEGFNSAPPMFLLFYFFSYLWLVGLAMLALYGIISYILLRRRVIASVHLRENIWLSDHVPTPFILGWIKPRIYLPSEMPESLCEPVIAHERAHLKRGDHWIKLLGFVLLCVYWFHPLVWVAYILLCRDIELACDERVIRQMETEEKKSYSEALLACGIKKHRIAACPLAFGEVGVKQRIKAVLNYKKPTLWIMIAAVVALSILAVCFLTDPKIETADPWYGSRDHFKVSDYRAPASPEKCTSLWIEALRAMVPQYFDLPHTKGLEVYVWDDEGVLWCGLMRGSNERKTQEDIDALVGVPMGNMAMILDTYEDVQDVPLCVLGSSDYWGEESLLVYDGPLELWLKGQLGLIEVGISQNVSTKTKMMSLRFGDEVFEYQNTGETISAKQIGYRVTDEAEYYPGFIPSGLWPIYGLSVFTIKDEGTDRLAVGYYDGEGSHYLEIYEQTSVKKVQ